MASLQSSLKVNDLRSQIDSRPGSENKNRNLAERIGTPEKRNVARFVAQFHISAELAEEIGYLAGGLQEAHSIIEGYQTKSISQESTMRNPIRRMIPSEIDSIQKSATRILPKFQCIRRLFQPID
jgi:hypothetical protein